MPAQRYVSSELTHFVGRALPTDEERYSLLVEILNGGTLGLEPGGVTINVSKPFSANTMFNPHVVCFCDIPVDDLEIHMRKYSLFGLSFKKSFLLPLGANPVFYIANESLVKSLSSHAWNEAYLDPTSTDIYKLQTRLQSIPEDDRVTTRTRRDHFNAMVDLYQNVFLKLYEGGIPLPVVEGKPLTALHLLNLFLNMDVFSWCKLFDAERMTDDEENYYMEREWRVVGQVEFSLDDVWRIFIPSAFAARLRLDVPGYRNQVNFTD